MKRVLMIALLAVAATHATAARAVVATVGWNLVFYPPNPCSEGLTGAIGLYDAEGGSIVASPTAAGAACPQPAAGTSAFGTSAFGTIAFDLEPGGNVFASFAGAYPSTLIGPGNVFAFAPGTAEGTDAVANRPSGAPLVLIGSLGESGLFIPNPGPPELPLFAFASPGTLVGALRFTAVPAPGAAALFGLGLVLVAASARRRR